MKKIRIFWLVIILVFFLFLILLFLPKNYTQKYSKDKVEIIESYNKESKTYYFTFKFKDITLDYLVESNYKQKRTFINKIDIVSDDNNFCLIPSSEKLEFIPLCYQNEEIIHYSLANKILKNKLPTKYFKEEKLIENYKDIEIYNKDYTYFLWNYDGFYYINSDNTKKIDIFEKELYSINLVGITHDYLVIADYDSNYTFNNLYTIDFKNGNLKKHELDRNIYFDSYFIGNVKNKLYIVDNKESAMYEFNAKKGNIDKVRSKVLNKNNWKNVNIKTLINKKQEFNYETNYNYELKDNKLYLNYTDKKIKKLIALNITNIVRIKNSEIFYLKNDTLYSFNVKNGENKLLTYFEWNFNYENMIYIN